VFDDEAVVSYRLVVVKDDAEEQALQMELRPGSALLRTVYARESHVHITRYEDFVRSLSTGGAGAGQTRDRGRP
jgi:hypothetical protein